MMEDNLTQDNHSDNSTTKSSIWDFPEMFVVPALFAIIFVIGLVGNATLIFIVLRNKPMRTKPNVLIVNLSMGDFLLILVSVPFTSIIFTLPERPFGSATCKLNEFMQTLSVGVSIFTLTALSADRFIAIVYPLASYSSSSLTRVIVASAVIWVLSTGLGLMDLVGAHAGPCKECHETVSIQICSVYPDEWGTGYKAFRLIFRFVIYFAAPLIIIVCLYVIIAVVLLRQALSLSSKTVVNSSASATPSVNRAPRLRKRQESVAMERQNESRKKVAKVVLSFVIIFVVCWLPRHVYLMCHNLDETFEWNTTWKVLKIVGFCLMFIYSAINPLALYLLNAEFRRYFHHYLFGCCYKPWRIKNIGLRQSTANSFMGRSTYSVLSTGAVRMTTCSVPAIHRGTSVAAKTASDVIGSQTMTTTTVTDASQEDDNDTRL